MLRLAGSTLLADELTLAQRTPTGLTLTLAPDAECEARYRVDLEDGGLTLVIYDCHSPSAACVGELHLSGQFVAWRPNGTIITWEGRIDQLRFVPNP